MDIIIHHVEKGGLPVGEAGGTWYAKFRDVCGLELFVNLCQGYLFAPDLRIWRDKDKS